MVMVGVRVRVHLTASGCMHSRKSLSIKINKNPEKDIKDQYEKKDRTT